jgi:1-acyl-sn-glycerol-3-phosphate acyltransferase
MGFYRKVTTDERIDANLSYMIVANHTSMADIMLMLCDCQNPFVLLENRVG